MRERLDEKFNPNDHASSDIPLHRNISASLLPNDLTAIEKWGKDNLVSFNQSETKQAVISRKCNQNFPPVLMNGDELNISASFTQLGRSLSSNLAWKTHIHSLAKHASQKLGFLARARGFFSSSHLLSIYKSQTRPSLACCSHVWGGAPKSTLCLLDKVQSKAIRLINNPNLTKSLQPLAHSRLVGDLSIFYRYFNGHCSQEIRDIIPVPLRRVRRSIQFAEFVFKCLNGTAPEALHSYFMKLEHGKTTRPNSADLGVPKIRTESGRRGVYYCGTKIFNNLPLHLKTEKYYIHFRKALKEDFID